VRRRYCVAFDRVVSGQVLQRPERQLPERVVRNDEHWPVAIKYLGDCTSRAGKNAQALSFREPALPLVEREEEILALPNPRNRAWQKKQHAKIVQKIQDNSVGRADYSTGDFVEDVKRACAREAVPFDNDLFSDLTG